MKIELSGSIDKAVDCGKHFTLATEFGDVLIRKQEGLDIQSRDGLKLFIDTKTMSVDAAAKLYRDQQSYADVTVISYIMS